MQRTPEDVTIAALEGMYASKQRMPDLLAAFLVARQNIMALSRSCQR